MLYLSCPTCKKKVTDESAGYYCEKCAKNYPEATPMYNFAVKLSDFTNSVTVQCIGEVGEAFMGIPANQFYGIKDDLNKVK